MTTGESIELATGGLTTAAGVTTGVAAAVPSKGASTVGVTAKGVAPGVLGMTLFLVTGTF